MVVGWFGGGLLHKVDGCELKVTYSARSDALELSGELPKQREAYTLSAATISLGVQCAPLYIFILYIYRFASCAGTRCMRLPANPARGRETAVCVSIYLCSGCFNMTLLRIKLCRKCQLDVHYIVPKFNQWTETDCPLGRIRFTHLT